MTPKKLIRTDKVRSPGQLPCAHYVQCGNFMIWVDGRWICRSCRLAQIDDLDRIMHEIPRPSHRSDDRDLRPTAC